MKFTKAQRDALPAKDFAGPDRSFPIPPGDKGHAQSALGHIGNAPPSARPKIEARAKAVLNETPVKHGKRGME